MRTVLAVVLSSLILSMTFACTTANVTRMGEEFPPRPDDWPIAVYASGGAPKEVVTRGDVVAGQPAGWRIGRMVVKESMIPGDWDRSIYEAKVQARRIGGDAIYIGEGDRFGAATSARSDLHVDVYRLNVN